VLRRDVLDRQQPHPAVLADAAQADQLGQLEAVERMLDEHDVVDPELAQVAHETARDVRVAEVVGEREVPKPHAPIRSPGLAALRPPPAARGSPERAAR